MANLIEFHILQSFPVTCLNRDDVGAPKSALIGGVPRARVSSQCWKRQVRMTLHELGVKIAIRTKAVENLLEKALTDAGASNASELALKLASAITENTLFFFSAAEAASIANFAKENDFSEEKLISIKKPKGKKAAEKEGGKPELVKELRDLLKRPLNTAYDGLDIALFGRMAAQAPEMNMQAAASFAHAITTHRAENEMDFFTALDDEQTDEPGAAHMGALEFNSGTYYRYICLDLDQLAANLNNEPIKDAVKNFVKALYLAVPAARQTTQTGRRPWDFARILVRNGQGLQASFEKPVRADHGYLEPSIKALNSQIDKTEALAASLYGKIDDMTYGVDENFSIDNLIEKLGDHAEKAQAARQTGAAQ